MDVCWSAGILPVPGFGSLDGNRKKFLLKLVATIVTPARRDYL
jgi:hypothetical protein